MMRSPGVSYVGLFGGAILKIMHAGTLAAEFPTVSMDTPAIDAAKLMAGNDLPGLIVLSPDGSPFSVLGGTQVLHMAVPLYIQDDPRLASVVDEATADTFAASLGSKTVRQLLPHNPPELPVVDAKATLLETAALIARVRIPVVAVVSERRLVGAITADSLLDYALGT